MKVSQILSGEPGIENITLGHLWDGGSRYAPVRRYPADEQSLPTQLREMFWQNLPDDLVGISRGQFEMIWPEIYRQIRAEDHTRTPVMAVLDSGVLSHHPQISPVLELAVDLTGDNNSEDENGHGTAMAALATLDFPKARLRSAKIVDEEGTGEAPWMISGLEWLAEMQTADVDGSPISASMSVGIYSSKWWGGICRGTCKVCKAAIECASVGVILSCSAGNRQGDVCCPASLSYYRAEFLARNNLQIYGVGSYQFPGGLSNYKVGAGYFMTGPLQ